jgi:integrase
VKEPALCGLHGHALRYAYASLALEAGVPIAELKFLLNHSAPDATFGYLRPSLDHLRECQERASARILRVVGLRWEERTWPPKEVPPAG